jgi:hypothetical protein
VLVGQNASSEAALTRAAADSAAILLRFIMKEGLGYVSLLPGEIIGGGLRERRSLGSGDSLPQLHRKLQPNSCPTSCSTSNSKSCKSIGCANCRRCGRRLHLVLNIRQDQRAIESELTSELGPKYCGTDAGCSISAQIFRMAANGTWIRAG